MSDAVAKAIAALITHLAGITGLTVRMGFPPANTKLVMPALSVLQQDSEYTNLQPYELSRTAPDVNHKTTVKRIVGNYEVPLQLDLWCRNRQERQAFSELLFARLNPNIEPMGLRLQITDYHSLWVSYTTLAVHDIDDDASVQRQEWRARIEIVCSCKAVLVKDEFAIITIENQLSTPDTISS